MSDDLRRQIYNNMNLKDTDELLNIWVTNNRSVWTDDAIKVVEEILTKRNIELPSREVTTNEEMEDEEAKYNPDDFTEEERKILDDENPPEFYDPFEVLKLSRWGEIVAIASIVIALVSSLLQFTTIKNTALSYFPYTSAWNIIAYLIALMSIGVAVGTAFVFTYFPLKILANILKILMEMEFNSRTNK